MPRRSAHSCAVTSASPWRPISTTSSPTATSSSPTSTMSWSIVTVPATGRRRPPTTTSPPTAARLRGTPSAYPIGTVAMPSRALDPVAEPVGEPVTGGERLHVGDARLQRERRPQHRTIGELRRGRDAVDRDADPHEIEARVGERQQTGRVRGMHQGWPQTHRVEVVARTAWKRSSCSDVYGSSGSSAIAKWVRTPSSTSSVRSSTRCASATAPSGATPTRCIPVSTLRCTARGSPVPRSATAFASESIPPVV